MVQEAEEKEMQKFIDYMKKQGLMIVGINGGNLPSGEKNSAPVNQRIPEQASSKSRQGGNKKDNLISCDGGALEITIYHNAVGILSSKRGSSSSEDALDTSDEVDLLPINQLNVRNRENDNDIIVDKFLKESRKQFNSDDRMRPHTSTDTREGGGRFQLEEQMEPRQPSRSEQMIRDTEKSRARIMDAPGNELIHSSMIDEGYIVVGSHVDDTVKSKIANGEYIDFSKLIPKDRVSIEEDTRMEMINRGGMSYWVPVSERENTSISSFGKWEQAFRVFSNVYTAYHPSKAGKLIQYNHVIHTASQTFLWENVYKYDREFRIHMIKHHLRHSWAVILQQAWLIFLKDKVTPNNNGHRQNGHQGSGGPRRRLCFDFNSGACSYGKRCKFDHRCSFCNKFGHGSYNCRKAMKAG